MVTDNGGRSSWLAGAAGRRSDSRSSGSSHMRGTMLWFNEAKDLGALQTDGGAQIDVPGTAFLPGEKPVGRCAGKAIQFEAVDGHVMGVTFVTDPNPRRARMRHRR